MKIDERLHRVLHDEAETVDVDPQAWASVQAKVGRRRAVRKGGMAVLAVALLAGVVGIGVAVIGDDKARVEVGPADPTTTTVDDEPAPVMTTTTTAPPPAQPAGLFPGVWPFTSQAEVDAYEKDPGVGMFNDPEATALEFAREYLKFPSPRRVAKDGNRFTLTPKSGAPQRTVVEVQEVGGGDGPWVVIGATTRNIQVSTPKPGQSVASPVSVSGTSSAYEATVYVEVREDGGKKLGEDFVMGGATEMGPFSGKIAYSAPSKPGGAIVFLTDSAEDGTVTEAAVVRVGFGMTSFKVYFHRGEQRVEVVRSVPRTTAVLKTALESLFAGPRPEDGEGLSSPFSSKTAGLLGGVTITDGTAFVDLKDTVENANSSAGSRILLEELDATVFQFSSVQRIEYRLRGSCDDFWQWLQYGDCRLVDRP